MSHIPIQLAAKVTIPESGVPNPATIDETVPTVGTTQTNLTSTWIRLENAGTGILNILLWTAGAVLVISVILHSISYITSGGDSAKAGQARQGLVNSAIGLIIVTLTFVIVRGIAAFATQSVVK